MGRVGLCGGDGYKGRGRKKDLVEGPQGYYKHGAVSTVA